MYVMVTKKLAGTRWRAPILTRQKGRLPAEAEGSDPQGVGILEDPRLELGQGGVGIDVAQGAQELVLGMHVSRAPVGADADPEDPRRAPLSLRLADRIQDDTPDPFQIPAGVERIVGQAVLLPTFSLPPPLSIKATLIAASSHSSQ